MTTAERLMNEGHMRGRMEGREEGREKGRVEGIYLEKFQTIMKLRKINMKPEQIAEITRLTPETVGAVLAWGQTPSGENLP
jgi:predicted transposase YdaD